MEGIDRQRIDAIILRESGNSSYMRQQRRRDERVDARIANLRQRLASSRAGDHKGWSKEMHAALRAEIPAILATRPTRSAHVVVDMDMFYMACELLSKPELADRPACVGSGMILTSNYKARTYGVRSAMAGWIGDVLVHELSGGREKLIHVPSNFALYKEKSRVVRRVLAEYDPHLKAYSLDEAYMNLAPYLALKLSKGWSHEQISKALQAEQQQERKGDASINDTSNNNDNDVGWTDSQAILASYSSSVCLEAAGQVVHAMRQAVYQATGGLTCSAGLAPNSLLAKIASDRNKPNGQCLVGPDHELDVVPFLYPLSVRKVGGIGRVTEKILLAFGIETVRDLYEQRALVRFLFKPATAGNLLRSSLGCCSSRDITAGGAFGEDDNDNDGGEESAVQKGISRERTFMSGRPWAEINAKLEEIAHLLSADMAGKNLWARTITLKVKLSTFDVLSRSKSLARGVFIQEGSDVVALSSEILRRMRQDYTGSQPFSVRLLGIRAHNFRTEEDDATGTFRVEDYFRDDASSFPKKAKSRATLPGQRSLDSFFTQPTDPGQRKLDSVLSQPRNNISAKSAIRGPETAACEKETKVQRERMFCPVCHQVSFLSHELAALNRHLDECVDTPLQSKPTKKRRLKDFWT